MNRIPINRHVCCCIAHRSHHRSASRKDLDDRPKWAGEGEVGGNAEVVRLTLNDAAVAIRFDEVNSADIERLRVTGGIEHKVLRREDAATEEHTQQRCRALVCIDAVAAAWGEGECRNRHRHGPSIGLKRGEGQRGRTAIFLNRLFIAPSISQLSP